MHRHRPRRTKIDLAFQVLDELSSHRKRRKGRHYGPVHMARPIGSHRRHSIHPGRRRKKSMWRRIVADFLD